mmetsp:Transcript_225/g.330  ORF Transcript_225/g.330 Transcript_225/m.330 type:complete len:93 (-) Transcript_225:753-1031(-)
MPMAIRTAVKLAKILYSITFLTAGNKRSQGATWGITLMRGIREGIEKHLAKEGECVQGPCKLRTCTCCSAATFRADESEAQRQQRWPIWSNS